MREIWQMTLEEVYRLDYTAEGVFDRTPDRKNPDQDNGIPRRGPEAAQDDTVDLPALSGRSMPLAAGRRKRFTGRLLV